MKTETTSRIGGVFKVKKNGQQPVKQAEKLIDANVYAQKVEQRAYEIWEKNGHSHGNDWNDWFEAERAVEAEMIERQ